MTLFKAYRKLKLFFYLQKKNQLHIKNQTLELEWAHVYHDSIKGSFIEKLPLNVGRWAGNYTFFYILNRVLADYKPLKILEFGLGESTKVISTYLKHELLNSKHFVVEQDRDWLNFFLTRFTLSENTEVEIFPLKKIIREGEQIFVYEDIDSISRKKYDLFVIDGPFGSLTNSRIEILQFVKNMQVSDQFIIIMDDCQRDGEYRTFLNICKGLDEKGINYSKNTFQGNKTVGVIATEKYKWIVSV